MRESGQKADRDAFGEDADTSREVAPYSICHGFYGSLSDLVRFGAHGGLLMTLRTPQSTGPLRFLVTGGRVTSPYITLSL